MAANPHFVNPLMDATEIEVTGRDTGRISQAAGYDSHGQPVRRIRNKAGTVTDVWLAGARLKPEKSLAAEMERKYAPRRRRANQISASLHHRLQPRRGTPRAAHRVNRTCGRPDRPRA